MGVNDILNYVKHTPQNTNPNILKIMLEELTNGAIAGRVQIFNPTIEYGEEGQCTNYEELAGLENGQVLITQDGGYIDLGGTEGISYLSAVIGTKSDTTFTFKPKFIWIDGEQGAEENSRTFEINLLNGDIT